MEQAKKEWIHNPEAFIPRDPGFYVGGVKLQPGDTIINDNHGLPIILRTGICG
jgi:regulator of RNase E activity RraA